MKIIILGAGQVGGTLAENLVDENNDITVVDTNPDSYASYRINSISGLSTDPVHIPVYCGKRALKMPICSWR